MMHVKFILNNNRVFLVASPSIYDFLFQIITLVMENPDSISINESFSERNKPAVSMYRDKITGKYHIQTFGINFAIKKKLRKAAAIFALRTLVFERTGDYLLTIGGLAREEDKITAKEISKLISNRKPKEKKYVSNIVVTGPGFKP